ncbi:MAG: acetylornithine transaminase [Dehalococcoidales bacterium]|nr:acetylornithine transaminase [Dehalococcoidales bacterium]
MTNWQEIESKYFMHTFDRIPVTLVRGKGARVWDDNGREYLDFVGGLAVNALGHCHPTVIKALTQQAKTLIQTSNLFYTVPQLQLAELLAKNSCLQKSFFCNSGAEANEGAVKLARRYGQLHLNGAYEVITALNSFHGRTLAMVAATGQARMQKPYLPMPSGFVNVPFDNIEALKAATNERTCAVMLELVQGEGGVNVPPERYFKQVRKWCDDKGLLFILDEIQTGMGRLGTLFGYQQYGIEPDVMTLAKGLAGGVPIGAILAKEKASVFVPGEHGSTFGGNPLACAVALAALTYIIDHDIPGNARKVGEYLVARLEGLKQKYSFITDVRGRGLLLAIQFNGDISGQVMRDCLQAGLLVNNVKPNALRFIPPLIIRKTEVDEAITVLDKALSAINT